MARISSEKAALAVGNRYDLILIASARIRELHRGHRPKLETKYGKSLTALREIEEGLVGREYLKRISDDKKSKKEKFR
jgi:DNA-directed RNA polymerase omega subunit